MAHTNPETEEPEHDRVLCECSDCTNWRRALATHTSVCLCSDCVELRHTQTTHYIEGVRRLSELERELTILGGQTAPMCDSPLCLNYATHERRGILLCERHAGWIDRCFP